MKLLDWIFEQLQKRCQHDGDAVRADITEGGWDGHRVKWCLRCGAYSIVYDERSQDAPLRQPRATWATI